MYLVFTRMPGESDPVRLRSLLPYMDDVFRALINSCVLILHERSGPPSVSDFCRHQGYGVVWATLMVSPSCLEVLNALLSNLIRYLHHK